MVPLALVTEEKKVVVITVTKKVLVAKQEAKRETVND